jgi:hypothetical protein
MVLVSTNKPEIQKKPKPDIKYNDRSYESWVNNGFSDFVPHNVTGPRDRIQRFLNEVDLRRGQIERSVNMLVRLKSPDFTSKKNEMKEWVYYQETWTGPNHLGIPLSPVSDHIEGKYMEVLTKPKLDEQTGEHIDNIFAGTRERFYIPFNKKNVDDIIKNSVTTDKTNIKFIVKFSAEDTMNTDNMALNMSVRNQFTYNLFVCPWERLKEWQFWPIDDISNRPKVKSLTTTTTAAAAPTAAAQAAEGGPPSPAAAAAAAAAKTKAKQEKNQPLSP